MGSYVNVTALNGETAERINELWAREFPGEHPLIMTPTVIKDNIASIRKEPAQKHLHWIKTVQEWNAFWGAGSSMAQNNGQIFIGSCYGPEEEEVPLLKKQVEWVIANPFLFKSINGLGDAREDLGVEWPYDFWEDGRFGCHAAAPGFNDLPPGRGKLYALLLEHGRPDIWEGLCEFRQTPSDETWARLRNATVPWSAPSGRLGSTIWQLCEYAAKERDGEDYGLEGRFRDGKWPTEFELMQALLPVSMAKSESEESPSPSL